MLLFLLFSNSESFMLLIYKKISFKTFVINLLCHWAHAVVNEIMFFFLLLPLTLIIMDIHDSYNNIIYN